MDLFQVTAGGVGGLLIYCGVKGYNPRDVISYAFGGSKPMTFQEQKDNANDPLGTGSAHMNPDGSTTPGPKTFPDGADAGPDGDTTTGKSPLSFHPTIDPPPRPTNI